jgi:hypothetical protein
MNRTSILEYSLQRGKVAGNFLRKTKRKPPRRGT